MKKEIGLMFFPKSLAIVGASDIKDKVGAIVLKNIIESGYKGKILPVNPKYRTIGELTCFPTIESLPEVVDLVVIAIPAAGVLEVIKSIGIKGIKNVIVYSAGFKEIGKDGEVLERELIKLIDTYQLNLLGPNCLGLATTQTPLNATFGKVNIIKGNLKFISQSGALATSLFDWFGAINLGFRDFVTLGNKSSLTENDFLEYWLNQNESEQCPIGIYLESIADGQQFITLTKKLSKKQPVFLLKPGKSKAAALAMKSHTGSIAGEDSVLVAAVEEAGIIRCGALEDFFDYARAFAWSRAPEGKRIAIVSNAGGPAVLTTDALIEDGLELAPFSAETSAKLAEYLPRTASLLNPVDILGDALADRFAKAAEIVLQEDTVDAVLVILTPQLMTQISETAKLIGGLFKKYNKPVYCSFIGGGYTTEGENILNSLQIPSFRFPERAVKTMAVLSRWRQRQKINAQNGEEIKTYKSNSGVETIVDNIVKEKRTTANIFEADEILKIIGLNTPGGERVKTIDEAKNFGQLQGWPVVLKLSSSGLLHKSDVGGVIVGINNESELQVAWDKMDKAKIQIKEEDVTIQIQKQVDEGVEVIVGIKRDPTFGPVMLFGAGGKMAELLADRNLTLLPLDRVKAERLIQESKVFKLLNGFRGGAIYPINGLIDLMMKMSDLVMSTAKIQDIEINPVIVTTKEAWAVDGKLIL